MAEGSTSLNLTEGAAFLWGYAFRDGAVQPISDLSLPLHLADPEAWVWLHFPLSDQRARAFIEQIPELPEPARRLILDVEARVQIQFADGCAFGVLPDLERDLDGKAVGTGRLQFCAGRRRLITARRHTLRVVDELRRECDRGAPPESPHLAVVRLVERYVDLSEIRMHEISELLDSIEDHMLDEDADLEEMRLGHLRREISRNHREFLALRSALHRADSPRETARVPVVADHLPRLTMEAEDLDRESVSLLERARLLHEEIDTRITSATNRSMKALTIISTMLIPPTLITGAFGMNVPGIPFAGAKAGFFAALLICAAVVTAAWYMLRRMRVL